MSSCSEGLGESPRELVDLMQQEGSPQQKQGQRLRGKMRGMPQRKYHETVDRTRGTDSSDRHIHQNKLYDETTRKLRRRQRKQNARKLASTRVGSTQFPTPIVSNRIVGQDVEINEDQVSHLVPAPDGELHLRTWKTLGKVHDSTSIIEMLRKLDREQSMEFARIARIGMSMAYTTTPVLIDVHMADIERVVGSGIASIFSQRDGDNNGDECDLSDEFRSNMDSESEVPDTVQPHSDREVSPTVESLLEKSPDVPMNDSESGGNDSNDHRDRLMTENVNYQGPNAPTESSDTSSNSLESLQQRDKGEEEPLAFIQAVPTPNPVLTPVSISEPDLHSPKDISMDRALNSHEAEIHRFRECLIEAKRNMDRARGQVKEERLEALLGNLNFISLIIESLKYETILKNVFDLLSNASQDIPIVNDHNS
ncbi:hypothetical protein VE00_06201 [Pseudogymnoascus sp. WSF 3629]|nr:hypothetical protein VE00_06201 [Pseudogymnoascus sp. WSF 3629]